MPSANSYRYVLSLPERVVRSLSALSGGLMQEVGAVVIPARLRRTALYRTMVEVTLRFMIEYVGQVEGVFPSEEQIARNFLLKKTAGHGIELLGIFAFHVSPIWVLAALADATGAGHKLISEIAGALKEEGLLDRDSNFESIDQLLDGLERTSAHLAQTLYLPPVDVADLRRDWKTLQRQLPQMPVGSKPPLERLEQIWRDLQASAREQKRSVFMVSSLMAVSAATHVPANLLWLSRVAGSAARSSGKLLGETLLNHYVLALEEISRTGFLEYWRREFRPYLKGAAEQFDPGRQSLTERLLLRAGRRASPPDPGGSTL
ncbi:MAG TPA: hypothetical protein DEQ47_08025 [Solibacterales bacterium]|nr:hypothetical protein [Bryobacterales bacterium]